MINGWILKAGAKAKAKAKGDRKGGKGNKGKGTEKGNKGKGKGDTVCKYFAAGYCNRGENCNMSHDTPTVAAVENTKTRVKPKAKATAAATAEQVSGN